MSNSAYLRDWMLTELTTRELYISLHIADPAQNGAEEIEGGGYRRQRIEPARFAPGHAKNANVLEYEELRVSEISHFGVWDSQRGGHFLIGGALILPVRVLDGQTIRWKEGELSLHIN